jgi:hypothetical protein
MSAMVRGSSCAADRAGDKRHGKACLGDKTSCGKSGRTGTHHRDICFTHSHQAATLPHGAQAGKRR